MPEAVEKLSRRRLLQNAAAVVGVASSAALAASCAPPPPPPPAPAAQPMPPPPAIARQTKAQALYRDFPHGRQRCGVCIHFRPPNGCEIVEGPISPGGWCRNFARGAGGELG